MALRPLGLDPEDPAVKNAVLGVQVTEWMEGPVGSFVMDRVRRRLEVHEAEHAILECLGETLWRAQQEGGTMDAEQYLECVRRALAR